MCIIKFIIVLTSIDPIFADTNMEEISVVISEITKLIARNINTANPLLCLFVMLVLTIVIQSTPRIIKYGT